MLNAARDLRREGVDVVVGLVETHGRRETEALLDGLEALPRQRLEYHGKTLRSWISTPSCAVVRRWRWSTSWPTAMRRVRATSAAIRTSRSLLDAGIDVYTTLNVQHLESLNDVVEQITGVRVREKVPDAFLDRLRDIVLVDLPPRELIERLRQGKVYVPEQAQRCPQTPSSRRRTSRRCASSRCTPRPSASTPICARTCVAHGAGTAAPIRRRVLVAVDGHEPTPNTWCASPGASPSAVRRPGRSPTWRPASERSDREQLHAAFQLAQRLGAETVILRGTNVADEILSYASRQGVSSILIGQDAGAPDRPRSRPHDHPASAGKRAPASS